MKEIIEFKNMSLFLLDQRKLPHKEEYIKVENTQQAAKAIKDMAVRGAPAIGITAAYSYCLGLFEKKFNNLEEADKHLEKVKNTLIRTRPTAVNLKWALEKMESEYNNIKNHDMDIIRSKITESAHAIKNSEINANKKIGENGAEILKRKEKKVNILTHCNAGALATGGWGTALGVIRTAYNKGILGKVYCNETRPRLQGAKLTCYELKKESIPYILLCDSMSGMIMKQGKIDAVVVGADRIAANGDVANKIGTYMLACLAKLNKIDFYVAAPESTFDFNTKSGERIKIEQRDPDEVLKIGTTLIAPEGTKVFNPGFDITPKDMISAYITEKGVINRPDELQ
ncbi:MAG: S-methyl-5-thioribose-1-phosphate isomerase [Elusimicrobiota bacterium]